MSFHTIHIQKFYDLLTTWLAIAYTHIYIKMLLHVLNGIAYGTSTYYVAALHSYGRYDITYSHIHRNGTECTHIDLSIYVIYTIFPNMSR